MIKIAEKIELSGKAKRIKELRIERGWTQSDLARESGVSRGTIQNIESGRHGQLDKTLGQVLKALGGMENASGDDREMKSIEGDQMEENLIRMARTILRSGTAQASALHANIIAFYDSLKFKKSRGPTSKDVGGIG